MTEWWQGFGWGFVFAWLGMAFNQWVAKCHELKLAALKRQRKRGPDA